MKHLLLIVSLLVVAQGCRSLSPPAGSAQAGPPQEIPGVEPASHNGNDDQDEGWLFRRLTERSDAGADRGEDSGVRQASALEPADSSTVSVAPATLLPPMDAPGTDNHTDDGTDDKEDSKFEWPDLNPSHVYKNLQAAAGYGPDESLGRTLYAEGEALFDEQQYDQAAGKFKSAAARWPASTLEEDALFMLGESQFFSDKYPDAEISYEKLLEKYDFTRHLDTVTKRMFAIGRYWEQLHAAGRTSPINLTDSSQPTFDTDGHALKVYETIQKHDPTGPLADDAVMATANAYFLKGRYEEAAYQYGLLRKEFPKSNHQLEAHQLGMESRLRMYQGSMYDGGPLDQAGDIADQMLSQFSTELGAERDRTVQAKNRVVEEQAERDWTIAQYYDKKKDYGAASIYYKAIVEEYPQTAAAAKARKRREEIKDLPAEPVKRFGWLTNIFESDDR